MVVGEVSSPVDLMVVGGGPGGYSAALHAARLGRSVTLVERAELGGTCLNVGCIPSKALIEVADAHSLGARVRSWGLDAKSSVDMASVRCHLNEMVVNLTDGVQGLLANAGVSVTVGHARFTRPGRVSVERDDVLEFLDYQDAIVATGSRPIVLPEVPTDGKTVVDSADLLFADTLPDRLVLVGGGYVGVELGCAFAKLGSEVTIVEVANQVLPSFDGRTSRQVARGLRDLGIGLCLGHRAVGVDADGLIIQNSNGDQLVLPADRVCIVAGRQPNSDTVAIERAGAIVDPNGFVRVDTSRRANEHLYAIGDLTLGPALAHKATAEAEVAADAACGRPATFNPAAIPLIVFGDPQVLSVGIDPEAAENAGLKPSVARFPLSASGRAHTQGRTEGTVTVVADEEGTVIGVQAVGAHVAELAGEATLAVETAATVEDLAGTIHAHPTLGESLMEAALGIAGRPIHSR